MDHAVRRKRANSSLRLTSLKRKKTTERLDESRSYDDNDNNDDKSGRILTNARSLFTANLLPSRDLNSLSFQPRSVNWGVPGPTVTLARGANKNTTNSNNKEFALAAIDLGVERLNIVTSATSPYPSASFLPSQSQNLAPQPPSLLNTTTVTSAWESFPGFTSTSTSTAPFTFSSFFSSSSPISTPTHKPRRPRIITSMMSRRVANLPTGKGGAPIVLPPFVSMATNISTDSTDSQGSVRTQVPGSYHQQPMAPAPPAQGTGTGRENEHYYGQIDNGSLPFATPDLNSSSTFTSMTSAAMGKGLNPNSQPFAPPGEGYGSQFGSQYGSPSMGHVTPKPAAYAPVNGGYAPLNNGYATQLKPAGYALPPNGAYVPPQSKMTDYGIPANSGNGIWDRRGSVGGYQPQIGGNMAGYPTSNPYGQGMGAVQYPYGTNQNGGPPPLPYNAAPNTASYGQYGQGAGMNGYGYQSPGQVDNGYTNNANYSVANSNQNYPNNPYAPAVGNGYQPQGQTWGGQYQAQAQYSGQAPYVQPSNANRGKSAYYKPNAAAAPYYPSNLATAPVVNYNQGSHPEVESYAVQNGGPVQPPSRVNSTSPTKSKASTANSTANSSAEPPSPVPSVHSEEKVPGQGSPTPVSRRLQEFSSEPRNSRTPTLRSRRGQTVVPSTDPSNKQAMVNWLENVVPTPPPKMLSLDTTNTNLSGGDILAHAQAAGATLNGGGLRNDADPFTVSRPTPVKPAINPFAPLPAHLAPYMGGGGLLPKPAVSAPLRRLTANGKPAISDALEPVNLPFVEYCRMAREDTWGVIKIKNIPYSVNRPEVLAFLGRNARIISEQDFEPVHIVMERVTSKTLDCYVEFINFNEAVNAVNRFETNRTGGRGGRLGQRHVEVELSCQEQLMRDLFPKAKNVTWSGSRPIIKPRDLNDKYNSGFQGFISKEELVMLVKHVEAPQRSPFSKDCPQRPFECLISTLLKYPWYMVDYITIEDRNQLHRVTLQLIDLLQERISSEHENINLTPMLLKRVWRAALKCPGFSPSMKDDICWKCGIDEQLASEMGVPAYPAFWKDLWTIGPKPGAPSDIVLYYAALIRETVGAKAELTLAQKAAKGHQSAQPSLFGELVKLIDLPKNSEEFQNLTLSQCADAEWAAIEQALRRALTRALTAGPSA